MSSQIKHILMPDVKIIWANIFNLSQNKTVEEVLMYLITISVLVIVEFDLN